MATAMEQQYDKVYRYCYFKVNNATLAEDLTQETFLKYFSQNPHIGVEKQQAYLYTIAGNLCIDHYRKRKSLSLEEDVPHPDQVGPIETKTAVEQAIRTLEPQEQELVFLRYINEVAIGEIAKILGISRFAVYRKTESALKKLKTLLSKEDFYE